MMPRAAVLLLAFLLVSVSSSAEELIVYTANQGFLSRIYLLNTAGQVVDYFEYEFYRFCDMEVIDNELYVSEAYAPRVLKVDLETGGLEVIVDDWSLYYFYDLAWDGTYLYVNEWDLNRYEIDGTKHGTASFSGSVWGGAWDGEYYWTLGDDGAIRCWDISLWPALVEVVDNAFTAPSARCRGLWFDGEYFWTAEGVEEELGFIFRFDHDGEVVRQWSEPAYVGWGACLVVGGTGVDEVSHEPELLLGPNRPNPFSSSTVIRFSLPASGFVRISVYDVSGRLVDQPVCEGMQAGIHEIPWSARGLAAGIYLCRIEAGGLAETMKMLLLN